MVFTRVGTIARFGWAAVLMAAMASAQTASVPQIALETTSQAVPQPANTTSTSPQMALYRQLRSVALDGRRVFHIRDADLDREDIHISLTAGTIAFTQEVYGHVTVAFFWGEVEMRLAPTTQP